MKPSCNLVIGASGFIGQSLIPLLNESNTFFLSKNKKKKKINKNHFFININNKKNISAFLNKLDKNYKKITIYFLAGESSVDDSIQNPEKRHPKFIKKLSNEFYLVSSSVLNWANLAILVDRDTYLRAIIKKAENTQSKNNINGFKNIEIELNSLWWREKEFKILMAPGLFKHNRLSHRGY